MPQSSMLVHSSCGAAHLACDCSSFTAEHKQRLRHISCCVPVITHAFIDWYLFPYSIYCLSNVFCKATPDETIVSPVMIYMQAGGLLPLTITMNLIIRHISLCEIKQSPLTA